MTRRKLPLSSAARTTRERVLEAAELLLAGDAEFSMRDLAAAADVSFATPFNQFGSKIAIMQALSGERIAEMSRRFSRTVPMGDAATRVLAAMDIAASVMLEAPALNRAIMGVLGAPTLAPGDASARSRALWSAALGDGDGLDPALAGLACAVLPDGLAAAFRGVLSFWTAGELPDAAVRPHTRSVAATLLLGFLPEDRRAAMLPLLRPT